MLIEISEDFFSQSVLETISLKTIFREISKVEQQVAFYLSQVFVQYNFNHVNVINSYGYVYVFVPRATRVLLTGVSENQLNIRLGRTMALTMFRTAFRVDAEINDYPLSKLIHKSNKNNRFYKRNPHRNTFNPSASSSKSSGGERYELNADDLFDGDFSDNERDNAHIAEYEMMAQQYSMTDYISEQQEIKQAKEKQLEGLSRQHKNYTCVEIFPIKTGITSTSSALQGAELDVPHCVLVNRRSDIHSMIVACSRAKNASDLSFCFDCKVDDVVLDKLSDNKVFEHKTILSQEQGGPLEQPIREKKEEEEECVT